MKHPTPAHNKPTGDTISGGLIGLVAALALTAAACGSSDTSAAESPLFEPTTSVATEPAQTSSTTLAPTTVAPPAAGDADLVVAASPPPASFTEVEDDYREQVDPILIAGRAIVDRLMANDPEAIHAQLGPEAAAEIPLEEIRSRLTEILATAPLTGPTSDRALLISLAISGYTVSIGWGESSLELSVVFNGTGEITALFPEPARTLPPDPVADYRSDVAFQLPFKGLWFVYWGGDTLIDNYHVETPSQRHAYDIVLWKDGTTHTGDGTVNTDYWAYGQPVFAPAGGTVVTAINDLPDQIPQVGSDALNPAGNHVVIQVAGGEYLMIAHMQPGSLSVTAGDVVEAGQQIGLVERPDISAEGDISASCLLGVTQCSPPAEISVGG